MALESLRPQLAPLIEPSQSELAAAKSAIINFITRERVADFNQLVLTVLQSQSFGFIPDHELYQRSHTDQAAYSKWIVAARLALASLQSRGLIYALTDLHPQQPIQLRIRLGNQSGGLSFEEYSVVLAQRYSAAPEILNLINQAFVLHDPDVYLNRIQANDMHVRVLSALRESVECYRNELFLAASILLGSASEGAWVEMASALVESGNFNVASELRNELGSESPRAELVQRRTYDTIRSHGVDYLRQVGISMSEWELMKQRADAYRRFRNYSVHFREESLDQLDYASVGLLLLNATEYFNNLYRLRSALRS